MKLTGTRIGKAKTPTKDGRVRVEPAKSRAPRTVQKNQTGKARRELKAWKATGKVREA